MRSYPELTCGGCEHWHKMPEEVAAAAAQAAAKAGAIGKISAAMTQGQCRAHPPSLGMQVQTPQGMRMIVIYPVLDEKEIGCGEHKMMQAGLS